MIMKWLAGFISPPKEVPACFTEAVKRTCELIIERARMERAWQEVWAARDRSQLQTDHEAEAKE